MVICEPGSIEPALKIRASIYILTKDEGGTGKPLKHMGQEMIFSRTFDCMAATNYDNPDQRIMPGENGEMTLIFRTPMVSSLLISFKPKMIQPLLIILAFNRYKIYLNTLLNLNQELTK